jgi:hypothetical protein
VFLRPGGGLLNRSLNLGNTAKVDLSAGGRFAHISFQPGAQRGRHLAGQCQRLARPGFSPAPCQKQHNRPQHAAVLIHPSSHLATGEHADNGPVHLGAGWLHLPAESIWPVREVKR